MAKRSIDTVKPSRGSTEKEIASVRIDATNGSEFQLVKSPSKGMKYGRSPIVVKKSPLPEQYRIEKRA